MDFSESDEMRMLREAVGSIAAKFGHGYYICLLYTSDAADE